MNLNKSWHEGEKHFDSSIDEMGQKKSRHSSTPTLDDIILRRITNATTFLPDEIQYFYYDFLKYTPTGYLTLTDFEKFYQSLFRRGMPENFAKYAFNVYDTNGDGIVDFEEFITGLYYTTKATPIEKIRWAFDLCDLSNFIIIIFFSILIYLFQTMIMNLIKLTLKISF